MKLDHCPSCGAKTVWVEHSTDTKWIFAAACPKCLLHMKISNGNVELTRPESEKERLEPRKPREWSFPFGVPIIINPDGTITYGGSNIGSANIKVREVIDD